MQVAPSGLSRQTNAFFLSVCVNYFNINPVIPTYKVEAIMAPKSDIRHTGIFNNTRPASRVYSKIS